MTPFPPPPLRATLDPAAGSCGKRALMRPKLLRPGHPGVLALTLRRLRTCMYLSNLYGRDVIRRRVCVGGRGMGGGEEEKEDRGFCKGF